MGIFPFQTPVEIAKMHRDIKHYQDFCNLKGYENISADATEFKAKNGIVYSDQLSFCKATSWHPCWIKEGVCYGYYEPFYYDGYVDPWKSETNFLTNKGYEQVRDYGKIKDFFKKNRLLKEFFEEHGYVPRWKKDDKTYGHEQALMLEGYKYEGSPSLELIEN